MKMTKLYMDKACSVRSIQGFYPVSFDSFLTQVTYIGNGWAGGMMKKIKKGETGLLSIHLPSCKHDKLNGNSS